MLEVALELNKLLSEIDPKYAEMYAGAADALKSGSSDGLRHSTSSMRELLRQLILHLGRGETRKARVKYILGTNVDAKLAEVLANAIDLLYAAQSKEEHTRPEFDNVLYIFKICEYTLYYMLKRSEKTRNQADSERTWLKRFQTLQSRTDHHRALRYFEEFTGKSIAETIDEARTMVNAGRPAYRLENDLLMFYNKMRNENRHAKTTAHIRYNAVRLYLEFMGLRVRRVNLDYAVEQAQYEPHRIPTQMEVSTLIAKTRDHKPRWTVLLAFLAQTGQGPSILSAIRLNMIKQIDKHGIVEITPGMPNHKGETVNVSGEKYRFVIPQDTMMLIHSLPVKRDFVFGISETQMVRILDVVSREAGVQTYVDRESGERTRTIHPSVFRLYWSRQMRESGIGETMIRYMLGHHVSSSVKYDDDELLSAVRTAEIKGKMNIL